MLLSRFTTGAESTPKGRGCRLFVSRLLRLLSGKVPFLFPIPAASALRCPANSGCSFDVGADFRARSRKSLPRCAPESAGSSRACRPCVFHRASEFLCVRPFGAAVEGEGQAVLGQIHGGGHEIVDRRKPCFALNVVIDDPEILQMRVAIAQRAVQRNQGEELLHVLVDMRWSLRTDRIASSLRSRSCRDIFRRSCGR